MRTWAKHTAPAAFLAAGVVALGSGTAFADTDGSNSVGGGNQINLPISAPVDVSGNAVGNASAVSKGGASVDNTGSGSGGNSTSGKSSILGGNQVDAPISVPVNACGNAIGVLGGSEAGCPGGATVKNSGKAAGGNVTSGKSSILGGNQIVAPISAPINACGNAIAIFGGAVAGCTGGATVVNSGTGGGAGGNVTSGHSSILGGNQIIAPINAPINLCGNSVAVLGGAFSNCKGGSTVVHGPGKPWKPAPTSDCDCEEGQGYTLAGSRGNDTDGRYGAGTGAQVISPAVLPVGGRNTEVRGRNYGRPTDVCEPVDECDGGTTVGSHTHGGTTGGNSGHTHSGTTGHTHGGGRPTDVCGNPVDECDDGTSMGNHTSGQSGILAGNQVVAPITAPINVCGNAVAVLGGAFSGCQGGASVKNSGKGAGGNVTSGKHSILGGNQVVAPITAPINACGNAVAALGHSAAHCPGGASADGSVGAGGNRTNGEHSILGGNQIVAPITAPINACGNAVAVLGESAAACGGTSTVGKPTGGTHAWNRGAAVAGKGGSMVPVAGRLGDMSALPAMPGLPATPGLPDVSSLKSLPQAPAGLGKESVASPLKGLPVNSLPVGDLDLKSAEDASAGMNASGLAALLLGAMFAVSATMFATTRRLRPRRK